MLHNDVNDWSVSVDSNVFKLVVNQQIAFDAIAGSVETNNGLLLFWLASGGTNRVKPSLPIL